MQNSAFNDSNIVGRVLADPPGRAAVEDLLQEQKVIVKALLEKNTHLVEALRDALLEREELIGREITDILAGAQQGRPGDRPSPDEDREPQPLLSARSGRSGLQVVTRSADGLSVESLDAASGRPPTTLPTRTRRRSAGSSCASPVPATPSTWPASPRWFRFRS